VILQRTILRLMRRLSGQNSSLPLLEVLPFVLLTMSLGGDRSDAERVVFVATFDLSGGAAPRRMILDAGAGEVEILSAWASNATGQLNLGVAFEPSFGLEADTENTSSTDGSVPNTSRALGTAFGAALAYTIEAPADTTVWLPLERVVIPAGRQLVLEGEQATLRGGFTWRELASQ